MRNRATATVILLHNKKTLSLCINRFSTIHTWTCYFCWSFVLFAARWKSTLSQMTKIQLLPWNSAHNADRQNSQKTSSGFIPGKQIAEEKGNQSAQALESLQYLIKKGGSGGTTLPHGVQKLDKTRVLGLLKASHYAALHHRHKLLVAQLSIIWNSQQRKTLNVEYHQGKSDYEIHSEFSGFGT